jgi:PAS domain S-box-containing protein
MTNFTKHPLFDEDFALRTILEGTAGETGERFFEALVENLAKALNTHGAWITEYLRESRRLRALAFLIGGQWLHNFEYNIAGTPCETVLEEKRLLHIEDDLLELYKGNPDVKGLIQTGPVSYMGVPLLDVDDNILGHMGVLDTRPMPENSKALAIFRIFAARATAELQRLRAEAETREREEKLSRLIGSAMDAIIELDRNFRVVIMNSAAEKVFECTSDNAVGKEFTRFLADESREKFASLIKELDSLPEDNQYLWIPGGLKAINTYGHEFPAEATLSRFEMRRETFFTLILRNVNERLEAERRIRSLSAVAEYLREEVKELCNFEEIIGRSKPMLQVLHDIGQVAETDATVLILGETGTGKELVARAIHAASRRREKPLIKVNCAAIPAALIESEFFGHEQGAFTGATKRREGRFALADGGTIFLDEIGELPLDLQVKLLRVLQEGEFEPVGSSKTRKVNVRVLAATSRNLHQEVQNGKFREDLYYRLNVFPIVIPPLRERVDDIPVLALAFAKKFSQSMGRKIEPLAQECIQRLKAYNWPGNVRELQNIIERAIITSQSGKLNLDKALPETAKESVITANTKIEGKSIRVLTAKELQELERQNIISALESVGWRITGENGAAQLMGIPPSTLRSRIKALGIKQPR